MNRADPAPFGGSSLLLARGDSGEAVADLQKRLIALGFAVDDPSGVFGSATVAAVLAFQTDRGLPANGRCGTQTWSAIVEAGFGLGSRLLYRKTPMLRGDDVAELQSQLSRLGFDPGRVDGIFGDQTVTALMDFQRNTGLAADGILGRRTLDELARFSIRAGASRLVTPLRERLAVARGPSDLQGRRFAVVEPGGFATGANAICRALRDAGAAAALTLSHPDPSRQAAEANATGVDCLVALLLVPEVRSCRTAYYRGFHYESAASRHLAELVQAELPVALGIDDGGIAGMALPILRETRMPAVEIQLGAPEVVVPKTAELARVVVVALTRWVGASWE
ncbi:MAG: peptidoglycan-binding protein [Acidimicrobiales bacterium]